jgi:hypothetical protein
VCVERLFLIKKNYTTGKNAEKSQKNVYINILLTHAKPYHKELNTMLHACKNHKSSLFDRIAVCVYYAYLRIFVMDTMYIYHWAGKMDNSIQSQKKEKRIKGNCH